LFFTTAALSTDSFPTPRAKSISSRAVFSPVKLYL
jgi:hypothetical protein